MGRRDTLGDGPFHKEKEAVVVLRKDKEAVAIRKDKYGSINDEHCKGRQENKKMTNLMQFR